MIAQEVIWDPPNLGVLFEIILWQLDFGIFVVTLDFQ